jgi:hypothetical protein
MGLYLCRALHAYHGLEVLVLIKVTLPTTYGYKFKEIRSTQYTENNKCCTLAYSRLSANPEEKLLVFQTRVSGFSNIPNFRFHFFKTK